MGFSAGNYTRSIEAAPDEFSDRLAKLKTSNNTDDLDQSDNPENWSAEKVKAAALMFQRNDQATQDKQQSGLNADAWVSTHPEFIDSKPNGRLLFHEVEVIFGKGLHTIDHYETAYQSLRASNLLQIDNAKDAAQRKVADKQRYDAAQKATPSEQDLYTMSMSDLRRLDAVENQKRMQREGETGGGW